MNALRADTQQMLVTLEDGADFAAWREQARGFAASGIAPQDIIWSDKAQGGGDLFAASPGDVPPKGDGQRVVRANRAFLKLAQTVILHRDPDKFALLYQLLWRLQSDPHVMEKTADPDVRRLEILAGHVRRDIHKMRAFVRFRIMAEPDGEDRYVAWFEPDHHIVRANARFFVNRFASQRWSILTPELCIHWNGSEMSESAGADRGDAPAFDAAEDLWQRYYASIFNPARLKVSMMLKEMPRRYWKNLPEAQLIPQLIAGAQARESAMVARGADMFPDTQPTSLNEIADGIAACRRCAIGCNGTRAVSGEGPERSRLLIVGEQPGDCEEEQGRPFVGPAGQLLDEFLIRVGLVRAEMRLTNAVKHFKFTPQGKRRLHQTPTAQEIDHCRWWLDAERKLVQPDLILALGASAGRALLHRTPSIGRERGELITLSDGTPMLLTAHPSYLLRLDGAGKAKEEEKFLRDLVKVRELLDTAGVR